MQRMLAYSLLDIGAAALIAVAFVAAWVGIGVSIEKVSLRRAVREFSQFPCPRCGKPLGEAAARAGKDVSPWEEIWGDDEGTRTWHCHPTCREVRCEVCAAEFVLRLNRSGDKCGPRLSVRPANDDGDPAAA